MSSTTPRCEDHGCRLTWTEDFESSCETVDVLIEVGGERARQFRLHGNNLENESGTGPEVQWAAPLAGFTGAGASRLEGALRIAYNKTYETSDHVTWLQILLEEFSEVAKESDPEKLRTELIQVAAVAVSWAEKIRDPESAAGRFNQVAHS